MTLTIDVPLRTVSTLNLREHWAVRASRARKQREEVAVAWFMQQCSRRPKPPCEVTLTRVAFRPLDDDNLAGALKHVRDEVAARLGIDDGDACVLWRYRQESGKHGVFAVRIVVTEVG